MTKSITVRRCSGALDDGTHWADVLVTPAATAQLELEMRARGLTTDTAPMTIETLMVWCSVRRAGIIDDAVKFEDFQARALAADVQVCDVDPTTLTPPDRGNREPFTGSPST